MRICGGESVEEMSARMGISHLYKTDNMACSHPEGVTEGLVCDADICGVTSPAEYLRNHRRLHKDKKAMSEFFCQTRGGYAFAAKYEDNTYLFRDLIGLKPLYYRGETFASEKKAFLSAPCTVLPGEVVKLPGTILHRTTLTSHATTDPDHIVDALTKSTRWCTERGAALLFSGGVDSCVLAGLSDAVLITCGVAGSKDLVWARKAARLMKKDLIEVIISEKEIKEAIPPVLSIIEERTLMDLEIGLLLYFVCQNWKGSVLVSGQGADELFGGYYKYKIALSNQENVRSLMREDFNTIYQGLERDGQIAERFSKLVRYPYLDLAVVEKSLGIPTDLLFVPQRKAFLREVARLLFIPEEIVVRPKKALQYGSGIHKIVKRIKKVDKRVAESLDTYERPESSKK